LWERDADTCNDFWSGAGEGSSASLDAGMDFADAIAALEDLNRVEE
jgi:hypothetical protein